MVEAIVLAGGKGTRLRSVVSDVPKPMAGVNGRPFLSYLLDDLAKQGITDVILAVGYKREVVMDYFGNQYQGMSIKYSVEEEALGTGGGIRLACEMVEGESALVINGDTYFKIDIQGFYTFFQAQKADLAMALKPMKEFDRYGTVKLDEANRIVGFEEKQYKDEGLINGGIYLFNKNLFEKQKYSEVFSFEKEVLEKQYDNLRFFGLAFDSYFIDIGIPKDYEQSQRDFAHM